MEAFTTTTHQFPPKPKCLLMTFKFHSPLFFRQAAFFRFSAAANRSAVTTEPEKILIIEPEKPKTRLKRVKKVNLDTAQLKQDWLESLSGASLDNSNKVGTFDANSDKVGTFDANSDKVGTFDANSDKVGTFDANSDKVGTLDANSSWIFGIDPDLSGALAVLKPDSSAQVYDTPYLKVLVGSRIRKRLDAKSITRLLQTIEAPIGTTAYIEQSIPFPQDGKQGWWSGGFGYGLWIGVLVASGYTVVPVPSLLWKNEFKLAGSRTSKVDSRELASTLFPAMSSLLKRKKDHGRAEALLIAGYGKGLKLKLNSSFILEEDNNLPQKQDLQTTCTLQT